jgi:protein-S-isoprenylcysteine O-methyltransferase Ste14
VKPRRIPPWLGLVGHSTVLPLFHAGVPWYLSTLGARHGWTAGAPRIWNLSGLALVALGAAGLAWSLRAHFQAAPRGWAIERTRHYPTPAYLLLKGPYRYSRNPIYVAEGAIWLGWIVFYGSLVTLAALAAMSLILAPIVLPREERGLEARFGDAYREYKRTAPRWLGRPRT